MLSLKSISETLAALGSAALIAGCSGSSKEPVNASEVPSEPDHAAAQTDVPAENTAGDAAAGSESSAMQAADAAAPAASASASAAASAAPAGSAAPAASASAAKKPGTKTGTKKKMGANGSCGEGTCG
jgi:hypothetical protein